MSVKPRLTAAERRASIIQAAVELFAERGFRGTTTRELASAAGITEPVLYEHFRTKRDLYSALIDCQSQEAANGFQEWLQRAEASLDDWGFFHELAQMIIAHHTEHPAVVRLLLFSALERHELADLAFRQLMEPFYRSVAGYIRRRQEQGAFRMMDPMLAARAFVGMVVAYWLFERHFNFRIVEASPEEVVNGLTRIFLSGICRNQEER